jgi:hypothetical protein
MPVVISVVMRETLNVTEVNGAGYHFYLLKLLYREFNCD